MTSRPHPQLTLPGAGISAVRRAEAHRLGPIGLAATAIRRSGHLVVGTRGNCSPVL